MDPSLVIAAKRLLEDPRVIAVYGFGSRARNEARERSDVDLAVLLEGSVRLSLSEELRLRAEVIEELRRDDVDLVVLNRAPPLLRYEVVAAGRRLVTRDAAIADAFEERTYREYFDTAHLRAVQRDLQRETLRETLRPK